MEHLEATVLCGHCGNVGICQVKASYTYDILIEASDEYEQRIWFLFQCTACSRPILAESVILEKEKLGEIPEIFKFGNQFECGNAGYAVLPILFGDFSHNDKILYPQNKSIEYQWMLPDGVYRAYHAALRIQKIDAEAFAIMVGRTLEEICYSEKAVGKVLADKIKSLANSGRIPQVLATMFTQLRLLRNLAAHAMKTDYMVKEEDVPIIREFIDAILEYLYTAPMKIAHLQDRINGKPSEFEGELL